MTNIAVRRQIPEAVSQVSLHVLVRSVARCSGALRLLELEAVSNFCEFLFTFNF